ncbi:MAG: hypothetical protein R3E12_07970 [Candidatus Eisenbacteria bacterium]
MGTIRAYFDSHMDLIDPEAPLDLRAWRMRTKHEEHPGWAIDLRPTSTPADRSGSLRSRADADQGGTVSSSILSPGVVVEPGAEVDPRS